MNQFTIRDVENLSGIKAHTWRIWEQRYGILMAQRKHSNHRFYDSDNLKEILRIAYLYHNGIKISKIAALDSDEIREMALQLNDHETAHDFYIKELVEASIDLDEERFERTFSEAIKRMGAEVTILHVCYPFQERIGVLWVTNHVIPAQEHFTSNIIRQKLAVAINELPNVHFRSKKTTLLFTPEHEMHELPLQFIHYLLKKNQQKTIYFGSNVPLKAFDEYGRRDTFSHVWFHLVTNLTSIPANDYLKNICEIFSDKEVLMSGLLVHQITALPPNATLFNSLGEVVAYTKQ